MSPIYVPGKVVLRQEYIGTDDPDAAVYIAAVEAADEAASPGIGALETGVKVAIHSFVKGCKADGIWPALKASCILAGARTLDGCLVPLVGTAPTSHNFVAGDYNRETGLKGNGTTKYINSGLPGNTAPQNNAHLSCYTTESGSGILIGSEAPRNSLYAFTTISVPIQTGAIPSTGQSVSQTGFISAARDPSQIGEIRWQVFNNSGTIQDSSVGPSINNFFVFARNSDYVTTDYTNARLAFYSIGESLDLALLDARVTALIAAIGAAIP